jgi:hypothetical protein
MRDLRLRIHVEFNELRVSAAEFNYKPNKNKSSKKEEQ